MNKTEAVKKICEMDFVENRDNIVVARFTELRCGVCGRKTKYIYVNLLEGSEVLDACPGCQVKINRIGKWLGSNTERNLELQ